MTPAAVAPPALEAAVPDADDVLRRAESLLRRWDTPLEATILSVVERRFADTIPTMAVSLRSDGVARLDVNPDFVLDVGAEGAAFVLCHEAMHLLLNHLREGEADQATVLGKEVVINHWVGRHTGRSLPVSARTGDPVGIDPRVVHASYAERAAAAVPYEAFVRTDRDCAAYLRALEEELPASACDHGDGDGSASEAVEEALGVAVQRALDGDARMRDELLSLVEVTPDAPAWDRVGVSELRGTTMRLGSTGFWRAHLRGVVARRLRPRLTVSYDRKVGWWDATLLGELGLDVDPDVGMPLTIRPGRSRRRHVAIYLDTSGSVPDAVVEAAADSVGHLSGVDVDWHTFDHEVHPFEPGDPLVGGGGTSFDAIVDDLAGEDDFPDAVLVLTDGWAPPVDPPHPERWVWLIVVDGDDWPHRHGMQTVHVPDLEGAAR